MGSPAPQTISTPDAERVYGIPRQRLQDARSRGKLKEVSSYLDQKDVEVFVYSLRDVLEWASTARIRLADKPLILEHLAVLRAGGEADLDATHTGEPEAEGLFSADQLALLVRAKLPPHLQRNARQIADISKAMAEMTLANTKQLRMLSDAGRLVDVKEVEILVQMYLDDWLAEVQDLPGNYSAEVAKRAKIPVAAARKTLAYVRDRLLESTDKTSERIQEETEQFIRAKAKRGRVKG